MNPQPHPAPAVERVTMKGHEVWLGRRRLVSLVGNPAHHRRLVSSLDTATPKRRMVRAALLGLTVSRLTPLLSRSTTSRQPELAQSLTPVQDAIGTERLGAAMVVWPGGDRLHRSYVTATDTSGQLVLFAKVSTRPDVDAVPFSVERELLAELASRPLDGIRTPVVIDGRPAVGTVALLLEAIPSKRSHLTWNEIEALLPFRRGNDVFVNGDVRPSNAVRVAGEVWVFDWEYGSRHAPSSTDIVSATMTRQVEAARHPDARIIRANVFDHLDARGFSAYAVTKALTYLAGTGQPWASRLLEGQSHLDDSQGKAHKP